MATARLTPVPAVAAVIGGLAASWSVALVVDRVMWRRIPFGVSDGRLTWSEAVALVTELRAEGRDVTVTAHRVDVEHPVGPTGEPSWTIRSTNHHRRAVVAAIARDAGETGRGGRSDVSRPDGG